MSDRASRREAKGVTTWRYPASALKGTALGDKIRKAAGPLPANSVVVIKSFAAVAVGAEVTIWTPAAGRRFHLFGASFTLSAAAQLTLKDNTAGPTILIADRPIAGMPPFDDWSVIEGIPSAAINNVLRAVSSVAANLSGYILGVEHP